MATRDRSYEFRVHSSYEGRTDKPNKRLEASSTFNAEYRNSKRKPAVPNREMQEKDNPFRGGGRTDFTFMITRMLSDIEKTAALVKEIAKLHERALSCVDNNESTRISQRLDSLQAEADDFISNTRNSLMQVANKTKRLGGNEIELKRAQQARVAQKLSKLVQEYSKVQIHAKKQYRIRMEREISIARPDASPQDIKRMLDDSRGGSAFAREMLNSRIISQKRVLQDVENRQSEMRKMEDSIDDLAQLFMDLQILLETQQDQVNSLEMSVNQTRFHVEDGGKEITAAIETRKKSRKRLWCLCIFITILSIIGALWVVLDFCPGFQCKQESEKAPTATTTTEAVATTVATTVAIVTISSIEISKTVNQLATSVISPTNARAT